MSLLGLLLLSAIVVTTVVGIRNVLGWAGEVRGSVVAGATFAWLSWGSELFGRVPQDIAWGAGLTAVLGLFGVLLSSAARQASRRPDVPAVVIAAALFVLFATVALTTWLWDERSAHFGISAAMARGALPAVHPTFADVPFAYHVGFNSLAALVIRTTGVHTDVAIDVVSLALLAALLWLLMDAGQWAAGRVGARTAPTIALLGYGPAALCVEAVYQVVPSCSALLPSHWQRAAYVPPGVASNFFQHPTALGMVVALAILLLALDGAREHQRRAWLVASVLVVALAQAHIVFFGLVGVALATAAALDAWRARAMRVLLERAALLTASLLLAFATARFFGSTEARADFVFAGHFTTAYNAGPAGVVAWNLIVFLPALAGAGFALFRLRAGADLMRVALLAVFFVGLIVGNVVSYERSWDIVKFFGAAMFAGNLLFVDVIRAVAARTRPLAVAATAIACLTGLVWVLRFGALNGVIAPRYTERAPDGLAVEVGRSFGDVIGQRRVLTRRATLQEAGIGLAAVNPREIHAGLLVDRKKRQAMYEAGERALREIDVEGMRALGASYFFLSMAEIDGLDPAPRDRLGGIEPVGYLDVEGQRWFLVPVPGALPD